MISRLISKLRCRTDAPDQAGEPAQGRLAARRARRAPTDQPAGEAIPDCEAMLRALRRQRLIADRTGRGFAWVVFQCRNRHDLARLAGHLRRRIRATDDFGLAPLDPDMPGTARKADLRLLVLLPETTAPGADRFAESIRQLYVAGAAPEARVYIYEHDDDGAEVPPRHVDRPARSSAAPAESSERFVDEPQLGRLDFRGGGDDGAVAVLERPRVKAEPIMPRPQVLPRRVAAEVSRGESTFASALPWWKRSLDVTAATIGLFVVAPLLAIIGVAIRLDSRGPAMFWQARAGRGGRTFYIAKFRTMVVDAEALQKALKAQSEQDGPAFKLRRDPRVTRVGRILRKTSLDELPQLWNVLKGEMTLVGPRPLPLHEADGVKPWQRRRLDVTPGLTCIWQVHGRSRVSFDEWMRMDLKYVARHATPLGPVHDLTLLLKTLPAVFLKRGF